MKYELASKSWDASEYQAVMNVFSKNMYKMGGYCSSFEEEFARWTGAKYAVFCNSGSSANLLAVAAIRNDPRNNFNSKNEVIVPAVSWSTTYYPLTQMGYKLKFVDVDPMTFNINIDEIERSISKDTCGIFSVNLLGNPCNYASIEDICDRNNLWLLEDNCESMGAMYDGNKTGTFGDISTHSTFFSHHISTMEGGVCTTDDELTYELLKSLRAHGWTRDVSNQGLFYSYFEKPKNEFYSSFHFVLPGFNFRPTEVQGALGIEQLKKIDGFVNQRKANAEYMIKKIEKFDFVKIQKVEKNADSSWFGFGLIFKNISIKEKAIKIFFESGIEVRPIVSGNMLRQPVFKNLNQSPSFSGADKIHDCGVMVGNHQFEIFDQIDLLVEALNEI